jgi:Family of unknown function (DUF5994)
MGPQTSDRPVPDGVPRALHVRLEPTRSRHTLLDGCWWPQSADPVRELPGLLAALDDLHGPVARLLLSAAGWSRRPHSVEVAGRVVGLSYFSDQPDWLLLANGTDGESIALMIASGSVPADGWNDRPERESESGHLSTAR